jgi:hypothetical protein
VAARLEAALFQNRIAKRIFRQPVGSRALPQNFGIGVLSSKFEFYVSRSYFLNDWSEVFYESGTSQQAGWKF